MSRIELRRCAVGLLSLVLLLSRAHAADTAESGTVEGLVTEKSEYSLQVKPEGQDGVKFVPVWQGGLPRDGGGFDKTTVQAIKDTKPGSKVRVQWKQDEFKRVVKLDVLELPKPPPPPPVAQNHDDRNPGAKSGTITGTIAAKGKRRLFLKGHEGGESDFKFLYPLRDGGYDPETMRQIERYAIGDKITLDWDMLENERRIVRIHPKGD